MKERESNIEAARILAMILVVLVHANYFSLGGIDRSDIIASPSSSFMRMFFEHLCIVGVNLFVLISGWFGIRPTVKGAISLLYQVLFYSILILAAGIIIGIPIPKNEMKDVFYFGSFYWFIPAYLCLYALSPMLNSFIEHSTRNQLLHVLIAFFFLEFIYGWITNSASFDGGYSTLSFIGLYLLARYVNKYSDRLKSINPMVSLGGYFIMTIIPTVIAFFGIRYIGHGFSSYKYCSPFVISAALFLFLFFQRFSFKSKFINWVACSVFSVYIVHLNPMIVPFFTKTLKSAYESLDGFTYCIIAVCLAVLLCLVCAVIDKVRISSWKVIVSSVSSLMPQKKETAS